MVIRSLVQSIFLGSWVMTMTECTGFRLSSAGGTGDRRDEAVLACVCCITDNVNKQAREACAERVFSSSSLACRLQTCHLIDYRQNVTTDRQREAHSRERLPRLIYSPGTPAALTAQLSFENRPCPLSEHQITHVTFGRPAFIA